MSLIHRRFPDFPAIEGLNSCSDDFEFSSGHFMKLDIYDLYVFPPSDPFLTSPNPTGTFDVRLPCCGYSFVLAPFLAALSLHFAFAPGFFFFSVPLLASHPILELHFFQIRLTFFSSSQMSQPYQLPLNHTHISRTHTSTLFAPASELPECTISNTDKTLSLKS